MFKVELQINHRGCWGSEINVKFPDHQFSSVDCRWIKGNVAHILLARGKSSIFNNIIEYLTKRNDVLSVEVLSRDDQRLYLRVITKRLKKVGHFSDIFFGHNCFPISPTKFEKTFEIWTLGTASKKNISLIYKKLKNKYPLKINYVIEEKLNEALTKKQRQILTYASYFGYYEWPRKNSVTKISKTVHIPKTVFLSHLRKAEIKIINQYLEAKQ